MILGIGHCKGVGKDFLANLILDECHRIAPDAYVRKQAFAYNLKLVAYNLYSWAGLGRPEDYDSDDGRVMREVVLPRLGKTPRQIWDGLGWAVRNGVYEDTFADSLLFHCHEEDVVIIPDVRHPNEVDAVVARGGKLANVMRPGFLPDAEGHDSKLAGWDGWHYLVPNFGDNLYEWAKQLAPALVGLGPWPEQSIEEQQAVWRHCRNAVPGDH